MPYANNKEADQSAHLRSLIGVVVIRCLDSTTPVFALTKVSRLSSWADRFASYLIENSEDRFSRDVAHLFGSA